MTDKLTVKRIEKLSEPGRHREGTVPGLSLQITDNGVKSWLLRYERHGRERYMGLGPLHTIDLEEARERARKARRQLLDGVDPLDARRAERAKAALEAARHKTFEEAATEWHEQNTPRWRNAKHAAQVLRELKRYAFGPIGRLAVADVDTGAVLRVLEQKHRKRGGRIWDVIPERARRLRQTIANVMDWSTTRGFRAGPNPAAWDGHLSNVLPVKRATGNHFAAMPYQEVPAFLVKLRAREGTSARALEFLILCAARTGEVIGAKWDEIDLDAKTLTIPASRMKGGKQHVVPLADRAVEILEALPRERGNPRVFLGPSKGKGLSGMSMLMLLRRMNVEGATPHGFRSSFRNWCAERTNAPNFVAEMALAHVVKGVEGAYRRTDLLERRRRLMRDWAKFCTTAPAEAKVGEAENVVAIRRAG